MEGILIVLTTAGGIIAQWWWVVSPFVLGFILWDFWLYYIRAKFVKNIDWTLLQLVVPQDVVKSPLAMEQVFAGLHSTLFRGSWWVRYVGGRVQEWFSLEMVSVGGNIYFYIYTPTKFRNLVESNIYAQYPDAEIHEVKDYVWNVPAKIPNDEYNLIGAEFILSKEDAYPIRVWQDFKFETKEGEADIDPMASIVESLSNLKRGEQLWIQFGIKPAGDAWKKEGEKVIANLIGRKTDDKKKQSYALALLKKELGDYATGAVRAPFKVPEYGPFSFGGADNKEKGPHSLIQFLTPGEREIIEAIERNIAKVGFESTLRIVYLAGRDVFNPQTFFTVAGTFRQFSTQNLNSLKWNGKTFTFAGQPFKNQKINFRKRWLLFKYRFRHKPEKSFIFNIEELATVFHFPGRIVTSPALPRIETKKGEAPPSLPIV